MGAINTSERGRSKSQQPESIQVDPPAETDVEDPTAASQRSILKTIMQTITLISLGIPFVLAGLFMLLLGIPLTLQLTWPVVQGVITHSAVVAGEASTPDVPTYSAGVEYEYIVSGKRFVGHWWA